MADKIIVSNNSALERKYPRDIKKIHSAIQEWIRRDNKKGISSTYIPLDDAAVTENFGITRVAKSDDEPAVKRAIDELHSKLHPDYIVILGSCDIVPHQKLNNPVSDPDSNVPSDLPYACNASYSRNIGDFVGASRVVSRLPDITSDTRISNLLRLIDSTTKARSRAISAYKNHLGVSTETWRKSTRLNLIKLFGPFRSMQIVPPKGSPWGNRLLSRLSHFFNCHGLPADPRWYGEGPADEDDTPVAHESSAIRNKITAGTVVAAECCYGAELFDPSLADGELPICNTYLQSGACAFWGSSNISYGPADANDHADLMCQYFFEELLKGASVGRATLLARQSYARKSLTLSPVDLKTLAQFMIYGDASTTCIVEPTVGHQSSKAFRPPSEVATAGKRERKQRRAQMLVDGEALQASRGVILEPSEIRSDLAKSVREVANRFGMKDPAISAVKVIPQFQALGMAQGAVAAIQATRVSEFYILTEVRPRGRSSKLLELGVQEGVIGDVKQLFSR